MIRWLQDRAGEGLSSAHAALLLRLVADERRSAQGVADRLELVWSGLDAAAMRDTSVVVRDLFRTARRSVLISSFALDRGPKASAIFKDLAARHDAESALEVCFFVNVHRPHSDDRPGEHVLQEFAQYFRLEVWPGARMPRVYYDPRALEVGSLRACLHAKCVVADMECAFITSANFTEAAHARNFEAGVVVADSAVAQALQSQFSILVDRGLLRRIPGL